MNSLVLAVLIGGVLSACARPETGMRVPSGTKAGDFVGWTPCVTHDAPASCGTLVVSERHGVAGSRLIALPVVRWRARQVVNEAPIFWIGGGPAKAHLRMTPPDSMRERHDVVLIGYRGADGSTRFECPEARAVMADIGGDLPSREVRASIARAMHECATRVPGDTVDGASYTVDAMIDDLETARRALAYDRVHLFVEPAGQPLAVRYAERHPARLVHPATGDGTWLIRTSGQVARSDRSGADAAVRCGAASNCLKRYPALSAADRGTGNPHDH